MKEEKKNCCSKCEGFRLTNAGRICDNEQCFCHIPHPEEKMSGICQVQNHQTCAWKECVCPCHPEEERGRNERQQTDEIPMGVSQWRNHGEKWKYTEFWKEEEHKRFKKIVEEVIEELEKEGWKEDADFWVGRHNALSEAKDGIFERLK